MRKTKVVMITSYFDRNGVTSQVMNYATNLNKNKFQVSIAAGEPYDIGYEKLCQENNIELCKLSKNKSMLRCCANWKIAIIRFMIYTLGVKNTIAMFRKVKR